MGWQVLFNATLSTVWSAPNYCYRCGNLASVLEVAPFALYAFICSLKVRALQL